MNTDIARILQELESLTSTLSPNSDITKYKHRYEEILSNYEISRKTEEDLENDFSGKVSLYTNSLILESYSNITVKTYERELLIFDSFIQKPAALITTPDIRRYLSKNPNLAPGTIGNKLMIIRSFYKWCVDEELLLRNPASKIKPPKKPKRLPKGFSQVEMEQIRQGCRGNRERALVEVFYSTGSRLSEISNMKIEEIDWRIGRIKVVGKGDKERIVYFNERSSYYLKKYLEDKNYADDDCEYIFSTEVRPYRKLSNRAIGDIIKKIAERTTIKDSIHPHRFRHTMATHAMENGIELGDLQQLLGHSDPGTTLQYASVSEERKYYAHRRFVQ